MLRVFKDGYFYSCANDVYSEFDPQHQVCGVPQLLGAAFFVDGVSTEITDVSVKTSGINPTCAARERHSISNQTPLILTVNVAEKIAQVISNSTQFYTKKKISAGIRLTVCCS